MAKDGKALERLVALVETALGHDGVKVETPKYLPDRVTGDLREHDVLVTITKSHHSIQIALECKDHSRPVSVVAVEAFHQKIQDTGIQQGAIVSTSGFSRNAREKAAHYGIRCLDVLAAESLAWMLTPTFGFVTCQIESHSWLFCPEKEGIVSKETMEVLLNGESLPKRLLRNVARDALNKSLQAHPEYAQQKKIRFRFDAEGLTLRNRATGAATRAIVAIVDLVYSHTHENVPLQLSRYKDGSNPITEVAIADGPGGRLAIGSVLFQVQRPDKKSR